MSEPKADGGAAVPCISLLGDAWLMESGHVKVPHGCASLSWGVCEQARKTFPDVTQFSVQIIITPNEPSSATAEKGASNARER